MKFFGIVARRRSLSHWLLAGCLAMVLGGCSTPKTTTPQAAFYPLPPDEPRLQFLMSISGEADVRGGGEKFKRFVVGKAPPTKPIVKPYGLALHDGKLMVVDTVLSGMEVIDLRKAQMEYFRPEGQGRLRIPINVFVDQDGMRYVTDTMRREVVIFQKDGAYVGALREMVQTAKPSGTNATWKPVDVAVSGDRLVVCDLESASVRVYNKADRRFLFAFPKGDVNVTNRLFQPTNLAVDKQGRIYVSDTAGFRVQLYDAEGNYLRTFGQQGLEPGSFGLPKGIAVDRENRLYVVDAKTGVAQIFDDKGNLLLFFGEPGGSPYPLNLPAKVIIDYDHVPLFQQYAAPGFKIEYLVLISNQYGDNKVSIYGFGHRE